jgi:dTDP-4-dehydrorhamnose reductase
MKILVLGADGMLGKDLLALLLSRGGFSARGTTRRKSEANGTKLFFDADEGNFASLLGFDAVLNCIGAIKQRRDYCWRDYYRLNYKFPLELAKFCNLHGIYLIHFSTDCVFDGLLGNYDEYSQTCPLDDYGKSKALGEEIKTSALVLRTSIIGVESSTKFGLMSWFLSDHNICVSGYTRAFFSGLTTVELSKICIRLLLSGSRLTGIYNVAGPKISKCDLLILIRDIYEKSIMIIADESVKIDRSLNDARFRHHFGVEKKSWAQMLVEYREFNLENF